MDKKVLFISYDGMTDPLGRSQVIPYLTALAAFGYRITIVSAEKPAAFHTDGDRVALILQQGGVRWHPVFFSNRMAGISAWMNYRRLLQAAGKVVRQQPGILLHCRSYIPALIGSRLKQRYGLKMIFDMRGFWADEKVEGGLWNLNLPWYRAAYRFFKREEKKLLVSSEAVVSLTRLAKDQLLADKDLHLPAEKIAVIPCCTDLSFFSPSAATADQCRVLKSGWGLSDNERILGYAGSLGTWYLLDEMMHYFSLLLQQDEHWRFLFVTPNAGSLITASAAKFGVQLEKLLVCSAGREQMPALLSTCDLGIFFIKNSFSKTASSPTKMGELLAMGVPVVCNAGVGDVQSIIAETGVGCCLPALDAAAMNTSINEIAGLLALPKEMIRHAAADYFSLADGVAAYQAIYERLS